MTRGLVRNAVYKSPNTQRNTGAVDRRTGAAFDRAVSKFCCR